jgi:hypothetical protein
MSQTPFRPTHRMLMKATEEHNYATIDIDVNNGTFKRTTVKMTETKIRVNKSILGEIINLGGGTKPLGLDEIECVAERFNAARVAAGFSPLTFRTNADEDRKESNKEIKLVDAAMAQSARDVIPLE